MKTSIVIFSNFLSEVCSPVNLIHKKNKDTFILPWSNLKSCTLATHCFFDMLWTKQYEAQYLNKELEKAIEIMRNHNIKCYWLSDSGNIIYDAYKKFFKKIQRIDISEKEHNGFDSFCLNDNKAEHYFLDIPDLYEEVDYDGTIQYFSKVNESLDSNKKLIKTNVEEEFVNPFIYNINLLPEYLEEMKDNALFRFNKQNHFFKNLELPKFFIKLNATDAKGLLQIASKNGKFKRTYPMLDIGYSLIYALALRGKASTIENLRPIIKSYENGHSTLKKWTLTTANIGPRIKNINKSYLSIKEKLVAELGEDKVRNLPSELILYEKYNGRKYLSLSSFCREPQIIDFENYEWAYSFYAKHERYILSLTVNQNIDNDLFYQNFIKYFSKNRLVYELFPNKISIFELIVNKIARCSLKKINTKSLTITKDNGDNVEIEISVEDSMYEGINPEQMEIIENKLDIFTKKIELKFNQEKEFITYMITVYEKALKFGVIQNINNDKSDDVELSIIENKFWKNMSKAYADFKINSLPKT